MSSPCGNLTELHSYSNELRRQGEFYDVVIKVENKSFPCHRIILASALKYFRNMFTQNYSEAEKKEIELKGFNADDFELLLTHIYGGAVNLSDNNVYRLLRISHYLNLKSLEDLCTTYLVNSDSIPLNAAIHIFMFANRVGQTALVEEFTKRMAENFSSVSKNEKFLRISGIELSRILSHPDLNTDATTTLDCLTNWMKCQSDDDRKLLPALLNAVHLERVPNEWLVKIIMENTASSNASRDRKRKKKKNHSHNVDILDHEYTCENEQLFFDVEIDDMEICDQDVKLPFILYTHDIRNEHEYYINRYKFDTANSLRLLDINRDPNIDYDKVEFCKSAVVDKINVMMMINSRPNEDDFSNTDDSDSDDSQSSENYSGKQFSFKPYIFQESESHAMKSYSPARKADYSSATMTLCGVKIYLYSAGEFHTFNCQTNEWIEGPKYASVRTAYSNLLSHDDSLYMIGGKRIGRRVYHNAVKDEKNGKFFQHYDIREGKWSRLPSMKYAHNWSASCVHDDILYVSGGAYLTYFKGYMECFDFKACKWRVFETSMPKPKMNHTLIAHNNRLWFFGGRNYKAGDNGLVADLTWYSYDLKERKWSDIISIPKTHGRFTTQKIFDVAVAV